MVMGGIAVTNGVCGDVGHKSMDKTLIHFTSHATIL